jgi:hypothetical protein
MPNITYAEYAALKKAAAQNQSTDLEDIAKRPYQLIKASDGQILCYPPKDGGPWTIGGEHPNDYFGAGDDGVATKGV